MLPRLLISGLNKEVFFHLADRQSSESQYAEPCSGIEVLRRQIFLNDVVFPD